MVFADAIYRAILVAGQETTASQSEPFYSDTFVNTASIYRLLYELVHNAKLQDELRAEIHTTQRVAALRGDSELNVHGLEGMPLLGATVKVGAPLHLIFPSG
ncbi:hypothetical protein GYMLUDRAFT_998588 [Collybiopsis luxurians FD-317 M1]|uniref:Uncharacterized protein n=1 Tax=Collybiopsis luxurians FD-317 M1 TaxID=944289 RepID=A0A0D0BAY7_9AGAR|nr:hypothetical protein GYMLUDRAFT_998588 [Collybiopsis luxurians FD-317 M1]